MCGPSDEQKQIQGEQLNFMKLLDSNYAQVFGEHEGILSTLRGPLTDIFNRGPNQQGFSPEERTTLNTEATESTARGYRKATEALGENEAAATGDTAIHSGEREAERARLAGTAENERSELGQKITMADYGAGRDEFQAAERGLLGLESESNPNAAASVGNEAGSAAERTASDISNEDMSIWNTAIGAVGAVGAAAAGRGH